ncbi:hypothetical protein BCR37DRAFT_377957 [Protomyces lactucae-debilis]|uniref:Uncharacterized protein n=1 Tax=Protomyces lactucae-debilis TaxID=2754530 RepID=A0A1Y2FP56_PROLT|nr:uncharacterized protein BCR37DRAFT_377957 [Protomyces lactucae-debilis]ORY84986.1 hypothetical protein BCR37DRAFT_377957 [Protomyces lactucae-debilis]
MPDQQSPITAVLRSPAEFSLPSKWTADILNLDSTRAKQAARLLALATGDQHARALLSAFDPSFFPESFTEPAQQPPTSIAAGTTNNKIMA